MVNEWEEFSAYTGKNTYSALNKHDTSYLGRFTFDGFTEFENLGRVLSIIARGYLFNEGDCKKPVPDPYSRTEYAKKAILAWCSVSEDPDSKAAEAKKTKANFGELSSEFPGLVTPNGKGWFLRHEQKVVSFIRANPDKVSKTAKKKAEYLSGHFTAALKKKVRQLQIPVFSRDTKNPWILLADTVIADALEQGPLKPYDFIISPEHISYLKARTPDKVPEDLLLNLAKYYSVHGGNGDFIPIQISYIDAFYSNNSFSKNWKNKLPSDIVEFDYKYGVNKFRMNLPEII